MYVSLRRYQSADAVEPVRDGLKIFALCDSQYGYTFTFQVYTGIVNVPEAGRASLGATAEMVIHLVRQLPATGYIIYTDNYFTMQSLLAH